MPLTLVSKGLGAIEVAYLLIINISLQRYPLYRVYSGYILNRRPVICLAVSVMSIWVEKLKAITGSIKWFYFEVTISDLKSINCQGGVVWCGVVWCGVVWCDVSTEKCLN